MLPAMLHFVIVPFATMFDRVLTARKQALSWKKGLTKKIIRFKPENNKNYSCTDCKQSKIHCMQTNNTETDSTK